MCAQATVGQAPGARETERFSQKNESIILPAIWKILGIDTVVHELRLTSVQEAQIGQLKINLCDKYRGEYAKIASVRRSQRRSKMENLLETLADESRTTLAKVLTLEQMKRLNQLDMQLEGPEAFVTPRVAGALKLTNLQKNRIQLIIEDQSKQLRHFLQDDNLEKVEIILDANLDRIIGLLTEQQKKVWKDLVGKKFDFVGRKKDPG